MDTCRAPCDRAHDGPNWFRLTLSMTPIEVKTGAPKTRPVPLLVDPDIPLSMKQATVIRLVREGKTYKEMEEETGEAYGNLIFIISNLRRKGFRLTPKRKPQRAAI